MKVFSHSISAKDMPELRADMIHDSKAFQERFKQGHAWWPHLQQASLFWVSAHLRRMASAAAEKLPKVEFYPELLPSPNGIVVWEGTELNIAGFAWKTVGSRVVITILVPPEFGIEQVVALTQDEGARKRLRNNADVHSRLWSNLELGVPMTEEFDPENIEVAKRFTHDEDRLHARFIARMAMSLWLLLGQTIITEEIVRPNKQALRRLKRIDASLLMEARYVTLRRSSLNDGYGDGTGEGFHYSHQWFVSGHWRKQPYGPGNQYTRTIWIHPHVKGPEGAPLLNPEKLVHTLRK